MSEIYKIDLSPVGDTEAEGAAKSILVNTKAKLGFVPNMYRTMANSPDYIDTYVHGYTAFREHSGFTPAEQEIVFLVISRENDCHYCTAAHSMLADKVSNVDGDALAAVRAGDPIGDEKLQALALFTKQLVQERGLVSPTDARAFLAVGYSQRQIMEIILAISVKILSNYSNHIFHTQVDEVFAAYKV